MTDKQMFKLLEDFINDSPLAENIKVSVSHYNKSFTPRYPDSEAYYNEANLLASILAGAENFLWWARRNNYTIRRTK